MSPSAKLGLGEYDFQEIHEPLASQLMDKLAHLYRYDPNADVHSAVEWTLQNWGYDKSIVAPEEETWNQSIATTLRWGSNRQGQNFTVIPGPIEFDMGPSSRIADSNQWLPQTKMRIDHRYAIATKEVTQEQFAEFLADHPEVQSNGGPVVADSTKKPVTCSWYQAASYCRWLSEQEGIPEDQMCFSPIT